MREGGREAAREKKTRLSDPFSSLTLFSSLFAFFSPLAPALCVVSFLSSFSSSFSSGNEKHEVVEEENEKEEIESDRRTAVVCCVTVGRRPLRMAYDGAGGGRPARMRGTFFISCQAVGSCPQLPSSPTAASWAEGRLARDVGEWTQGRVMVSDGDRAPSRFLLFWGVACGGCRSTATDGAVRKITEEEDNVDGEEEMERLSNEEEGAATSSVSSSSFCFLWPSWEEVLFSTKGDRKDERRWGTVAAWPCCSSSASGFGGCALARVVGMREEEEEEEGVSPSSA